MNLRNNPLAAFLIMLCGILSGSLISFSLIYFMAKIHPPFGEIFFNQAKPTADYLRWVFLLSTPLTFILPALWVARTYQPDKPASFLRIDRKSQLQVFIPAMLALFFGQAFISLLGEWNSQLVLPESLSGLEQWMKAGEQDAALTTKLVMQTHSYPVLLVNLLLLAILPGFCEELLFRGVIQNLLIDTTKRVHLAVWITAFIFSFIHFQFYSFLPRVALGLLLGYLVVWTRSLWPSIVVHIFNNALVVILTFSSYNKVISPSVEKSLDHIGPASGLISLGASLLMLYLLKLSLNKNTSEY